MNQQDPGWVVEQAAASEFEPGQTVALTLEERLRFLPGRRAVWKAHTANQGVLLKAYDAHPKQARDVEREWSMAVKLANSDVNVAKPLFKARHPDGRLGVAFAFLPNGETLHTKVNTETLRDLFRLVAAQHDAGFYQTDNHLGNYLATDEGVVMLDAGTCRSTETPLTKDARMRNLAIVCATIPLRNRNLMDEALSSYFENSRAIDDTYSVRHLFAKALTSAVSARLARYLKKTRRACTEFVHEKKKGFHWLACRDLSNTLADKLRENPNSFFEGQPLLKDGNTCTVVRLPHEGTAFVLKRYNPKTLGYRLRHACSMPRALRSWSCGHALRSFGVDTPRPMACYLIYAGSLLKEAYLLMEEVDGISLHESPHPERMAAAYASLSEELRLLHAAHGDMKASNFLVTKQNSLTLIDLDSFCFHKSPWIYQRHAAKDRERFLKNWRDQPEALAAFRDVPA